MDILAHALWAGAGAEALRRKTHVTKKSIYGIVLLAALPDVLQLVPILGWVAIVDGSIGLVYAYVFSTPGTEPHLPPTVQGLTYHLHCIAHSAIVAGAVTLLAWLLRPQLLIPLLGWWSHIILDVFTHSKDYYPAPILYPITYAGFDGIAWNEPIFLLLNYLSLALIYVLLLFSRRKIKAT
jgi:hypothetical protein